MFLRATIGSSFLLEIQKRCFQLFFTLFPFFLIDGSPFFQSDDDIAAIDVKDCFGVGVFDGKLMDGAEEIA